MQLKEAEEREENSKKMYDRMFKALEEGNSNSTKWQEELFNSTSTSIAREIDGMHKEF